MTATTTRPATTPPHEQAAGNIRTLIDSLTGAAGRQLSDRDALAVVGDIAIAQALLAVAEAVRGGR
jgi:hypothetical protein